MNPIFDSIVKADPVSDYGDIHEPFPSSMKASLNQAEAFLPFLTQLGLEKRNAPLARPEIRAIGINRQVSEAELHEAGFPRDFRIHLEYRWQYASGRVVHVNVARFVRTYFQGGGKDRCWDEIRP